MSDALLILNAGSSSLKFTLFSANDPPAPLLHGQFDGLPIKPRLLVRDCGGTVLEERSWAREDRFTHQQATAFLFHWGAQAAFVNRRLLAVGHRVVHGGTRFTQPVRIDDEVLAQLEELVPLAPLHQPHHLAAIRAAAERDSRLPQVACFDTAFHRTQPELAQQIALPRRYAAAGVRRYGFHGLSYEYIASVLPELDPPATGRTIVAHLGNGASLCALQGCRSVATTMGFTPLDGVPMGTRCGSIDPGVLLYLLKQDQLTAEDLERLLYDESGLLGVSGISSDMRDLLASDHPHAAEAVALFVYRVQRELGSLAAALGGLDALVFTGGIGEHAVVIRERVCRGAGWLGIELDDEANAAGGPRITAKTSRVAAWVLPTNEEVIIARQTLRLLDGG